MSFIASNSAAAAAIPQLLSVQDGTRVVTTTSTDSFPIGAVVGAVVAGVVLIALIVVAVVLCHRRKRGSHSSSIKMNSFYQ